MTEFGHVLVQFLLLANESISTITFFVSFTSPCFARVSLSLFSKENQITDFKFSLDFSGSSLEQFHILMCLFNHVPKQLYASEEIYCLITSMCHRQLRIFIWPKYFNKHFFSCATLHYN